MTRKVLTVASVLALAASPLLADFSYQEKSTVTGGAMASILKIASVFSKQAREPIQTTVSVKGDRMASRSATHASIIDLNSQTITSIDMQKKTYTVMTFEQMKQMMEQAQQQMQKSRKDPDAPQMTFKVSANATGNVKTVAGFDTREMILKMVMEGADEKTGQKGGMSITTDMWIAPAVEGYREVREFHKRMAEKLNWSPSGNMFAARPDVSQGMAEVYKEVGKLDGMPVEQKVIMGADGDPSNPQSQQQQSAPAPRPSLGGLLGVSRSKSNSSDAKDNSSSPGSLLEMTTELSGFSAAPVDDAQFAVPANFKKVEPDARRMK